MTIILSCFGEGACLFWSGLGVSPSFAWILKARQCCQSVSPTRWM